MDHRIVRFDGTTVCVQATAELLRDHGGHPKRLPGTIRDITERKQAEAALRESEGR